MVWMLREEKFGNPFYDYETNMFTIKMHHSGVISKCSSGKSYVGGREDYFDFCEPGVMTVDALHAMARVIGETNLLKFYCSRKGHSDFLLLDSDGDVQNLVRFMDENRVVSVLIENVDPISTVESQAASNYFLFDDQASEQDVELTEDFITNVEESDRGAHESNADDMVDFDSNTVTSSSEEECGDVDSDYECDDEFEETDFEFDDQLFDDNVDKEIEWADIVDVQIPEVGNNFGPSNSGIVNMKQPTTTMHGCKNKKRRSKLPDFSVYQNDADNSDFEFEIGMKFKDAAEFRDAVRKHSNKQGRPLTFYKNCSNKIQVTCKCGWVIYASFMSNIDKTFQVKSIKGHHTCTREPSSKHCTSKFLALKYQNHIRSNPEWPVDSMQEIMQMENRTLLSISKMYRAKKHAGKLINGTESEQYARLWDYCDEIKRTNPNTTVKIKCKHILNSGECTFKRIYICWGALKKGFKEGCRPVIGLDGTHLKTERGGVLLTAVGIDGNNNMYPIAYAVVLSETRKTWDWFITLLIDDLDIKNSYAWTIIFDKQKGLIRAVEDLLPHAEHRFCVRHMYNNFKTKHKGLQLKDLIWRAATSTRVVDFERIMEQIKATDHAAYKWVMERPPKQWTRSHFNTWPKCDLLLNNFCESFNKSIMKARNRPIITMLEIIRMIIYKRLPAQRDKIMKANGEICPTVQKILENKKKKAHEFIVQWNGEDKFEVKGWFGDSWTVELPKRTCSCRKWDLTGLPCVHAIACVFYKREKVENYVCHWYQKNTYIKAYNYMLQPIKGKDEWPKSELLPLVPWPEKPKKAGRPKQHARRKDPDELIQEQDGGNKLKRNGFKYRCSNCGQHGHNIKGCKEPSNVCSSKMSKISERKKLRTGGTISRTDFQDTNSGPSKSTVTGL